MKVVTNRFGFYTALVAFLAASGYCVVQVLQVFDFIRFPVADILIYGFSLFIAVPFMLSILALHHSVPFGKKIWSHASLVLAVMYAVYASFVYVVQLATVVPKMIDNNSGSIQVLVMEPHSFFWSLDALTYICMGLSTLFGAFAFQKEGKERIVRWFFLANAMLTPIVGFVYFFPEFSTSLLWIASPWMVTAPGSMLLLALYFRKRQTRERIEVNYKTELVEVWEE
jgi:hypothetical protein